MSYFFLSFEFPSFSLNRMWDVRVVNIWCLSHGSDCEGRIPVGDNFTFYICFEARKSVFYAAHNYTAEFMLYLDEWFPQGRTQKQALLNWHRHAREHIAAVKFACFFFPSTAIVVDEA